jgi:adenylate cyclase, class 2
LTKGAKSGAEVEIKLRVESPAALQRRLRSLGFRRTSARHFESNHLFDFPDSRLERSGRLLRLRQEDGGWVVTFKGPPARSRHYKVRKEIESPVARGERVREVFEMLGLKETFCYQKFRTSYAPRQSGRSRSGVLDFDETPIGTFVELEGPRRWIDEVARRLGYRRQDYITASYAALYFDWCRRRRVRPGNMVFRKY